MNINTMSQFKESVQAHNELLKFYEQHATRWTPPSKLEVLRARLAGALRVLRGKAYAADWDDE